MLKKLFFRYIFSTVFLMMLALAFSACNNMSGVSRTNNNKGNVYLKVDVASVGRTALPDFTDVNSISDFTFILTGKGPGASELTPLVTETNSTGEYASLSALQSASFPIQAGEWTFKLTASKDGTTLSDEISETITSDSNTLSFALKWEDTNLDESQTGSLSFELDFSAAPNKEDVKLVTAGLVNTTTNTTTCSSTVILDRSSSPSTYKATYDSSTLPALANLPAGTYRIILKLFTIDSSTSSNVLINTWTELAIITGGQQSSGSRTIDTLNEVYSIIWNLDGGSSSLTFPECYTRLSEDYDLPAASDMTKTGYTFGGWYTNSSFTGDAVTSIPKGSTGTQNLYAKWNATSYTITFDFSSGGGWIDSYEGSQPSSYTIESEQILLPDYSKVFMAGYDFIGWYTDNTWTTQETFIPAGSTEPKTFVARWEKATYHIVYHYSGTLPGTNPETYQITDDPINLLEPESTTTIYGGWYEDSNFEGDPITTIPTGSYGNKELWALESTEIHVSSGGNSANNGLCASKAVDSISAAIEKIVDYANPNIEWSIVVDDEVVGIQTIYNTNLTSSVATKLTLTGLAGAVLNGGSLTNDEDNKTTLTVNTTIPITITNLDITGGRGTTVGETGIFGGGLFVCANSKVTLGNGVKIYGNGCIYGGGVFIDEGAVLCMCGTAIVGDTEKQPENKSSIYNSTNNAYSDWRCANFASAESASGGGGIYNKGTLALGYSSFTNDINCVESELTGGIYGNWAYRAGGIFNSSNDNMGGRIVLKTGNIANNSAYGTTTSGGAGIRSNGGEVDINGGTISNNHSTSGGAGLYLENQDASCYITAGEITGNHSYNSDGAAIYIMPGKLYMSGGTISGNQSHNGSAQNCTPDNCGGISMFSTGSVLSITGGTIKENLNIAGDYTCSLSLSSGTFTLGGSANIEYSAEKQNYFNLNIPVTFDMTNSPQNDNFAIKWKGTPTTSTSILTSGDSSIYEKFNLLNDGWTIDTSTGKAKETLGPKSAPTAVGDIVFNDGSAIAYTSGMTLDDNQKANAIAVIFYAGSDLNNGGDSTTIRVLGTPLSKYSSSARWCTDEAKAYDTQITSITCTYEWDETLEAYTFNGDKDGRDNLNQIASELSIYSIENDTYDDSKYPAFWAAKNYGSSKTNISGTAYEDGWYLPTDAELYEVYKFWKTGTLDEIVTTITGSNFGISNNNTFVSATQHAPSGQEQKMIYVQFSSSSSYVIAVDLKTQAYYICPIFQFSE